ncbi:MAG: tRNA (adenosine(37)-N6)-threonylcarbamoyltransferase complex dimerization subunit type 1 TsaB [Lachnospiraceae bacterium]|nr:tRNA (adenosine(37)-N6)-threonylcarbamoyltransferase complex dimerization subunit type 1 TsaB [Lachnospiraceae bacterium]
MKILALDSSGLVASVAIVEDDTLVAEYTMNYKKTHSQTLMPMLAQLTEQIELDLHSLDAIAVAAGPGSFTGLRIGAATVKGLGLALDKPIVPVPTVAGLAYNLYGTDKIVCPLMDARRNQVYTGIYQFISKQDDTKSGLETYTLDCLQEQCAVPVAEITAQLNTLASKLQKEVVFLGDGVPVYRTQLEETLQVKHSYAPAHFNRQRAAAVAALGLSLFKEGKFQTADEHAPEYLRLSQAERERKEKGES